MCTMYIKSVPYRACPAHTPCMPDDTLKFQNPSTLILKYAMPRIRHRSPFSFLHGWEAPENSYPESCIYLCICKWPAYWQFTWVYVMPPMRCMMYLSECLPEFIIPLQVAIWSTHRAMSHKILDSVQLVNPCEYRIIQCMHAVQPANRAKHLQT